MSVDCAHLEQDWELFALGSLDEAAQRTMASHVQSCKECQRRFAEARAVVASIATSAPARQPSMRVERALMKRVRAEQGSTSARSWPRWNLAPWAVAAACFVLAGWFFWQQRRLGEELAGANSVIQSLRQAGAPTAPISPRIAEAPAPPAPIHLPSTPSQGARAADNQRLAELAAENEEMRKQNAALSSARAAAEQHAIELQSALSAAKARTEDLTRDLEAARNLPSGVNQTEIAALNAELSDSRAEVERLSQVRVRNAQIERLLRSGSVQEIELRAVDPAAGKAFARVLYSPQGGLLLVADALPKLDHEKCYQLWVIRKGTPAILSAGLLQSSDDGRGFLIAQPTNDLAQLTGLAITDEPKGGSVSARGHKLLFGAR
jgi:anti-sigma-K factor RskA